MLGYQSNLPFIGRDRAGGRVSLLSIDLCARSEAAFVPPDEGKPEVSLARQADEEAELLAEVTRCQAAMTNRNRRRKNA